MKASNTTVSMAKKQKEPEKPKEVDAREVIGLEATIRANRSLSVEELAAYFPDVPVAKIAELKK